MRLLTTVSINHMLSSMPVLGPRVPSLLPVAHHIVLPCKSKNTTVSSHLRSASHDTFSVVNFSSHTLTRLALWWVEAARAGQWWRCNYIKCIKDVILDVSSPFCTKRSSNSTANCLAAIWVMQYLYKICYFWRKSGKYWIILNFGRRIPLTTFYVIKQWTVVFPDYFCCMTLENTLFSAWSLVGWPGCHTTTLSVTCFQRQCLYSPVV